MNLQNPQAVTGLTKAAIVALMLGEESSSQLFRHMSESEVEMLAQEMAELGPVPGNLVEKVMSEFHAAIAAPSHGTRGGVDYTRRVLTKSVGESTSRAIMDRVQRAFQSNAGFAAIDKTDPNQLSKFIAGEHPQTIALILARLNPNSAAQLITMLPEAARVDVLTRMANIEEISPEVVTRISDVIESRIKSLAGPTLEQSGGLRAVADLFNRLDRAVSAPVLEALEEKRPELAVSIRNLMFVFDDFAGLDDTAMREIVPKVERKDLVIALKGASEDLRRKFFGNMSRRAADMVREEMDVLGAVKLKDVEKGQQNIVAIARRLEDEGVISMVGGSGEAYVA